MSIEETDSQMSAMFDDALPSEQCELLVRRILRDESLRNRWARYAAIGAALRGEPLARRAGGDLATRVRTELAGEPALIAPAMRQPSRMGRWYKGALGAALAAGVAALSIMVLRVQTTGTAPVVAGGPAEASAPAGAASPPALVAGNAGVAAVDAAARTADDAAAAYVVPPAGSQPDVRTSARLANYVVAHSEYATPMARLNRLSSFMTSDIDADGYVESVILPAAPVEQAGNAQVTR